MVTVIKVSAYPSLIHFLVSLNYHLDNNPLLIVVFVDDRIYIVQGGSKSFKATAYDAQDFQVIGSTLLWEVLSRVDNRTTPSSYASNLHSSKIR